jgi:hypothetical protein
MTRIHQPSLSLSPPRPNAKGLSGCNSQSCCICWALSVTLLSVAFRSIHAAQDVGGVGEKRGSDARSREDFSFSGVLYKDVWSCFSINEYKVALIQLSLLHVVFTASLVEGFWLSLRSSSERSVHIMFTPSRCAQLDATGDKPRPSSSPASCSPPQGHHWRAAPTTN